MTSGMKYKLSELGRIVTGKTPSTKNKEFFSEETDKYLFITPRDMNISIKTISSTERYLTNDVTAQYKNLILGTESICVSCIGTIGKVFMPGSSAITNQQINSITDIKSLVIPEYLYYYLSIHQKDIENLAGGTTMPIVNKTAFESLEVEIPDLETQKKIVRVLSVLDEKIELNNQENKNLEIICEYLHKETIKNNDCKKTTIGNYCKKVITGGTPSTKNKSFWGGNIPFVTIPDMHNKVFITNTERTITEAGVIKSKITPKGSIVVSCIATVGLVGVTSLECQTNQQVNSIVPKNSYDTYFLYETLRNMDETLKAIGSTGSATLNVNKTAFSNVEIQIPNQEVIKRYHTKVSPLFKKIHKNEVENLTLISIRNNLLPKLMSGEINLDRIGT